MTNDEVSKFFDELANILTEKEDNWFKINSYKKAADIIRNLNGNIHEYYETGKLREINGIGEAINKKVGEILTTGKLKKLEELR